MVRDVTGCTDRVGTKKLEKLKDEGTMIEIWTMGPIKNKDLVWFEEGQSDANINNN